eukprot:9496313-Pyramimonas_sp.AAC.1
MRRLPCSLDPRSVTPGPPATAPLTGWTMFRLPPAPPHVSNKPWGLARLVFSVAAEDHWPVFADLHWTPLSAPEVASRHDRSALLDPARQAQFAAKLLEVPLVPWGVDVNSHYALVTQQIREVANEVFPPGSK